MWEAVWPVYGIDLWVSPEMSCGRLPGAQFHLPKQTVSIGFTFQYPNSIPILCHDSHKKKAWLAFFSILKTS